PRRPGGRPLRDAVRGRTRVSGVDERPAGRTDRGAAEVLMRAAHGTTGTDRTGTDGTGTHPVSVSGAELRYGDRLLWSGLGLDVAPGAFVAVLGPNGSGKTSLLRMLLGLQTSNAGTVSVADAEPGNAGSRVGYIPQQRP